MDSDDEFGELYTDLGRESAKQPTELFRGEDNGGGSGGSHSSKAYKQKEMEEEKEEEEDEEKKDEDGDEDEDDAELLLLSSETLTQTGDGVGLLRKGQVAAGGGFHTCLDFSGLIGGVGPASIPGLSGNPSTQVAAGWLNGGPKGELSDQWQNGYGNAYDGDGDEDDEDDDDEDGDSLNIVLNENELAYRRHMHGNNSEDEEDEDDDLVILAGDDEPHGGLEWGAEQQLLDRAEDDDGGEENRTDKPSPGDDKGATAGKTPWSLQNAPRFGYGSSGGSASRGYLPSQFKYVRPGASGIGPLSIGQSQSSKTGLLKTGTGRGDWAANGRGGGYGYQKMLPGSWGSGVSRGFQSAEFALPPGKTVFDIDLDSLDEKMWRVPGVDPSDFFNFGFSESSWKEHCKQLVQLRLESSMQSKIHVYESGRSEQEYDPDLPPELAAAVGSQDSARRPYPANDSSVRPVASGQDRNYGQYQMTGRAIQVEWGTGDRQPSADRRQRIRDCDFIVLFKEEVEEEEPLVETGVNEETRCEEEEDEFEENETDDGEGLKLESSGRIHQVSQQRAENFVGETVIASRKDFTPPLKMNQSHSGQEINADTPCLVELELQNSRDVSVPEFPGVRDVDSAGARASYCANASSYESKDKGGAKTADLLLEESVCDDRTSQLQQHHVKAHSPKRQRIASRVGSFAVSKDPQSYRVANSDSVERHSDHSRGVSEEDKREDRGQSISQQHKRPRSAIRDIYVDSEVHLLHKKEHLLHSRELAADKENSHVYKLDMHHGRLEENKGKGRDSRQSVDRRDREDDFYLRRKQKEDEARRREDEWLQRDKINASDWSGLKRKDDEVSRRRDRLGRKELPREREEKLSSRHSNDDEVHQRRKKGEELRRERTENNEGVREHRARDKHEQDAQLRRREEDARRKERSSDNRQWKAREETWRDREDSHQGKVPHQNVPSRKDKEDERAGSSARSRRHSQERGYHGHEARSSDIEVYDRSNNKRRQDEDYIREKDRVDDMKTNDVKGGRRHHRDHDSPRIQEDRVSHRERISGMENLISRSSGVQQSRNERHQMDTIDKKETKLPKNGHSSAMGDETSQHNYNDGVKKHNTGNHRVHEKNYEAAGLRDVQSRKSEVKSDRHLEHSRRKGEHRSASKTSMSTKASSHMLETVSGDNNGNGNHYDDESNMAGAGRSKLERWMSRKSKNTGESASLGLLHENPSKTDSSEIPVSPNSNSQHDAVVREKNSNRLNKSRIEEQEIGDKLSIKGDEEYNEEEKQGASEAAESQGDEGKDYTSSSCAYNPQLVEEDLNNLTNAQLLEMSAKLEKRRERFRQPVVDEKKSNSLLDNETLKHSEDAAVKPERPMRKRRWGSG